MSRLTPKQRLFVDNYVVHYNAARAVKQTYGENPHPRGTDAWARFEHSARARGHALLTKVDVLQAIERKQVRVRQRFEFDEDMVVEALAGIVFTDLKDVGDWNEEGEFRLRAPEDIAPFNHGALRGIRQRKTVTTRTTKGEDGETTTEVETHLEVLLHRDKVPAAKLLLQHGGWLARAVKVNAEPGSEVNVDARTLNLGGLSKLSEDELVELARRMAPEPEE